MQFGQLVSLLDSIKINAGLLFADAVFELVVDLDCTGEQAYAYTILYTGKNIKKYYNKKNLPCCFICVAYSIFIKQERKMYMYFIIPQSDVIKIVQSLFLMTKSICFLDLSMILQ